MTQFRDERKLKKHIEVLKDDYEWYIRTHEIQGDETSRTGFSALCAMLLHSYRTVCENPGEYARHMVSIAKVDLTNRSGELVKEEKEGTDGDRSRKVGEGVEENESS